MAPKKQSKPITLEDMIRKENTAEEIMNVSGLSRLTIQKKVGVIQAQDKKYYDIDGLFEPAKPITFSGMGIILHKTRFMNSSFDKGDTFEMVYDDDTITLTKNK